MRFVLIVLLCIMTASPTWAGAWQRAKGGWFSATSSTFDRAGNFYNAFYAEMGLTEWLTIGVDAGMSSFGTVSALFFTRTPLWQSPSGHRLALEVAGGNSAGRPVLRPGLSYGQGVQSRFGPGWIAIDAKAAIDLWTGVASYTVDSTVGLSPNDKWKTILQFQTQIDPGISHSLKLAPSVVRRVGRRTHLELGLSETVLGGRGTEWKLGFWLEF